MRRICSGWCFLLQNREVYSKRASLPGIACHFDKAVMPGYNTVYHRQSHPSTLSYFFAGVKGFKYPRKGGFIHAVASIADSELDKGAGRDLRLL